MKLLKKSKPCLGSRAKQVFLRFDTKFTFHKGKVNKSDFNKIHTFKVHNLLSFLIKYITEKPSSQSMP